MIIAGLLVQAIICITLLVHEIFLKKFRDYATSFFLVIYFLLFIVEPLILHVFFGGARSIVRDQDRIFTNEIVYHFINVYGLTLLLAFVVVALANKRSPSVRLAVGGRSEYSVGWCNFLAVLMLFGFALFITSTGSSVHELLVGSRFSWFEKTNASILGVAISHYFFSLAPLLIYVYIYSERRGRNFFLFALAMLSLVAYGILSQDRKFVFYIFSAAVAIIYVSSGYKIRTSFKSLVVTIIVFFALFISQFIRDYFSRYMSDQVNGVNGAVQELIEWLGFLVEYGDISYFYRASLEAINQTIDHGIIEPFGVIRRNLLFFMPASWTFGVKPEDLSAIFSDLVDGGDSIRRGNMPPGFFGLFVMSFGLLAPIPIIALLPLLLKILDIYLRKSNRAGKQVILAGYISILLLLFRGDDSSAIYFIIFGVLIARLAVYLKPKSKFNVSNASE